MSKYSQRLRPTTTNNENSNYYPADIGTINQMRSNAIRWNNTSSPEERKHLADESLRLGNSIGAIRDDKGVWWDRNNNHMFNSSYNNAAYQDTKRLNDWKDAYVRSQNAELDRAYNNNLSRIIKSYNENYANAYNQINSTKNNYAHNIQDLYDDTYMNQAVATQQMANRGMTSSAQGTALNTAGLVQASKKASQLVGDRDTLINNIQSHINRLTADYNLDKDVLAKELSYDKLKTLSDADLKYITSALEIDRNNNNTYNNFLQYENTNRFNAGEAEKQRQAQMEILKMQQEYEREKALQERKWAVEDRDIALANAEKNRMSGGYGGGYSRGRYGGRYYRPYGGRGYSNYKKPGDNTLSEAGQAYTNIYNSIIAKGKGINDKQDSMLKALELAIANNPDMSFDEVNALYKGYLRTDANNMHNDDVKMKSVIKELGRIGDKSNYYKPILNSIYNNVASPVGKAYKKLSKPPKMFYGHSIPVNKKNLRK